jgi:hypothetical protein
MIDHPMLILAICVHALSLVVGIQVARAQQAEPYPDRLVSAVIAMWRNVVEQSKITID